MANPEPSRIQTPEGYGSFIPSDEERERRCACTLYAAVSFSGNLVRGLGAVSSQAVQAPGYYFVTFDRDVSECAYVATIASFDEFLPTPGEITVTSTAPTGFPEGVFVTTHRSNGPAEPKNFFLAVHCKPA
jgi:hypothetical protein